MDAVREKHKALLDGLARIYKLFITLRYIKPDDVLFPDPAQCFPIDVPRLRRLGCRQEAIDLTQLLPTLRRELVLGHRDDGIHIWPRTCGVNYFVQEPGTDADAVFDDLRWGYFKNKGAERAEMDPSMLRITDGRRYGTHLIYDVRDQTIREWTEYGGRDFEELVPRPASVVLSEWLERLQTLYWVPDIIPEFDFEHTHQIRENPIDTHNGFPSLQMPTRDELHTIIKENETVRERINIWKAVQQLYRSCGWGTDEEFRGDEFEAKRAAWHNKRRRLQALKSRYSTLTLEKNGRT